MLRTVFVCLSIVAAFPWPLRAATPAVTVLAPVSSPVLTVARALGVEPARDRVRFLPDFVRLAHAAPGDRTSALDALRRSDPRGVGPAAMPLSDERVVVPLDASVWSAAVFKRPVTADQLLTAIMLDRHAALLAGGLAQLDDETLQWFATTPLLLGDLYERGAAAFAILAPGLRIANGRIVPPGGTGDMVASGQSPDRTLWETLIGAPLDAPERVLRQLLLPPATGRLAYLYGVAAGLDRPRLQFMLGPSTLPAAARAERLRALATLAGTLYGEWRQEQYPFSRPLNDLAILLLHLQVDRDGRLLPPADAAFWADVWQVPAADAAADSASVDAAWLAAHTASGNLYDRGERLEQLAFAQRVFGRDALAARADAVAALRAFPRQRMLLLTLERMGLRAPSLYAWVSRQAAGLEPGDAARGFRVMSQLQPALALVARMTINGTIDQRRAEALVRSLFAVPLDDRQRYSGALARWMARDLLPSLPAATDGDTRLMLALAGPSPGARARQVEWEGERYRIDFAAAEFRRLQSVRDRQGGPTVEFAIALDGIAALLAASGLDADGLNTAQHQLQELVAVHVLELPSAAVLVDSNQVNASANSSRRLRDTLNRLNNELAQAARAHDTRRAQREVAAIRDVVDTLLGDALLSFAYAIDLGDPEGPALLSRNGALRHDFGYGRLDGDTRARVLWAVPRQDFQPGVAWHVVGSALGLDIALARLGLTRINSDRLAGAPRISSIERDGFAVGQALLDRRRLQDDTQTAIAAAIARGRTRVQAAVADAGTAAAVEEMMERLQWEPVRRRALLFDLSTPGPERLVERFTLLELLQLGDGPSLEALAAWGANALPLNGCSCTQMQLPSVWRLLKGRPQLALASTAVNDLNLRIAVVLSELGLPAVLARPVLAAAVQDFLEDAAPMDGGDWWALSEAGRAVSRERIEDYVAAVASVGGALIPADDSDTSGRTDR